jgi:heptosyltransferase II
VNEQGFVPSLGDVFRHTVLLHRHRQDHVTWLTSESALPLLEGNPYIDQLLVYTPSIEERLLQDQFDEVICLEKATSLCILAERIKAKRRYGFRWSKDKVAPYPRAESTMDIANGRDHFLPIEALLYQMVNDYWNGEGYILGYKPKPKVRYTVGLNFRVGSKWPTKRWPDEHWHELERMLKRSGIDVSWQQGATDLNQYMDWISGGRLIVTCDSLAMHLGLAMEKQVVALFGPTPTDSIYMQNRGLIINANWSCLNMPCMKSVCEKEVCCMQQITPLMVFEAVVNLLMREGIVSERPVWVADEVEHQELEKI